MKKIFHSLFIVHITLFLTLFTLPTPSEAGRYGGGFRSSSFRSSFRSGTIRSSSRSYSSKVSSSSRKSGTKAKYRSKSSSSRKAAKASITHSKMSRLMKSKSAKTAKLRHDKQMKKFKAKSKPMTAKQKAKIAKKNKKFIDKARSTNTYSKKTVIERRYRTYGSWRPAPYVYAGPSSYGMWDAMTLYWMLDNPMYYPFFYHHMGTPGMILFMTQINSQARENAELRNKVSALQSQINTMEKQKVAKDESYLPKGVDADILLADDLVKDMKPLIRFAAGSKTGTFYKFAKKLQAAVKNEVDIEVWVTNGSLDNLNRLTKGQVDFALAQGDAISVYLATNGGKPDLMKELFSGRLTKAHRMDDLGTLRMILWKERAHLLVNKNSGIKDISNLKPGDSIELWAKNSGHALTWANIVLKNPEYSKIKRVYSHGGDVGLNHVKNGTVTAMLFMGALNSPLINTADTLYSDDLTLASISGGGLDEMKDLFGNQVYKFKEISGNQYINLNDDDITTIITPAELLVSNKWISANPELKEYVLDVALNKVLPKIEKEMAPKKSNVLKYFIILVLLGLITWIGVAIVRKRKSLNGDEY